MNGRVYDPSLGRFLSVDPVFQFPENTQSLNPYTYVLNSPLTFTDPTGHKMSAADWLPFDLRKASMFAFLDSNKKTNALQARLDAMKGSAGLGGGAVDEMGGPAQLAKQFFAAADFAAFANEMQMVAALARGGTAQAKDSDPNPKGGNAGQLPAALASAKTALEYAAARISDKRDFHMQKLAKYWFGKTRDSLRNEFAGRFRDAAGIVGEWISNPNKVTLDPSLKEWGHVDPADSSHRVTFGKYFIDAELGGHDGKIETVVHEALHFDKRSITGFRQGLTHDVGSNSFHKVSQLSLAARNTILYGDALSNDMRTLRANAYVGSYLALGYCPDDLASTRTDGCN